MIGQITKRLSWKQITAFGLLGCPFAMCVGEVIAKLKRTDAQSYEIIKRADDLSGQNAKYLKNPQRYDNPYAFEPSEHQTKLIGHRIKLVDEYTDFLKTLTSKIKEHDPK